MECCEKQYLVVVQCHLVQERCSGYHCEKAFHDRSGGFARYADNKQLRLLTLTCGGCCGRALHRKLAHLKKVALKRDGIKSQQIAVHFSSCISKDNYHAPPCPHLDYLKTLVERLKLDWVEDSWIGRTAEKRRQQGLYAANGDQTTTVVISSPAQQSKEIT
ncbi:MAG: CGGC domain-containing protein [Desulfobacteraceae bacterium 4572_35.2]|nr:MAG: CGGC domain-containing protein [Desulfobacteraceae bacterium 4572_35.2]